MARLALLGLFLILVISYSRRNNALDVVFRGVGYGPSTKGVVVVITSK